MPDYAGRVLTLLQRVTSTLCVACLSKVTAVSVAAMRIITADLLGAGSLVWAVADRYQLCGKQPALRAKGGSKTTGVETPGG
jgi:hypothetical protein